MWINIIIFLFGEVYFQIYGQKFSFTAPLTFPNENFEYIYPLNNSFMFLTWKQLFLTCAKSPYSIRKWRAVNGASQRTHCCCSTTCICMIVWLLYNLNGVQPIQLLLSNVSNNWLIFTNSWFYLKRFILNSFKKYLLIDGLKLVKLVQMKENFVLFDLSFHSLGCLYD